MRATIVLLVFVVTMAYFVPEQTRVQGEAGTRLSPEQLNAMLRRRVLLNWIRQAIALLAFGAALHALGLSYRAAERKSALQAAFTTDMATL